MYPEVFFVVPILTGFAIVIYRVWRRGREAQRIYDETWERHRAQLGRDDEPEP